MKRSILICLLFVLLAAASTAAAQSTTSLIAFGSLEGHQPVSTINVPAHTSGQLTVSFHGDSATGCATQGICGYGGTVVFVPAPQSDIGLLKYGIRGHVYYQVQLNLPPGPSPTFTAARVIRTGGGVCSDAVQPNAALSGTVTGNDVAIGLIQPLGGLLTTRCAGPLDADLAGLGPQIRLTLGELLRGRGTVPLAGTWSFAARGFAGTITSNLTMTLGTPTTQSAAASTHFPGGIQARRERQVTETLTLVAGSGSLSAAVGSDPTACQFLDSCGIQGTLSGTLAPENATATLFVLGPAKRPYVDFLAALGLSRKGNSRGLFVNGTLAWQDGGSVTEQLRRGASCTSSAPLPGGLVILGSRGRRLSAAYSLTAPPRTRCPGPELGQAGELQNLASGAVPLAALDRPSFTIDLGGRGALDDDGYAVSQRTSLSLTVKRGRVHQRTFLAPSG